MALTINLPPHLRDRVARDVEAGRFESEEAAVIDALELAYERSAWEDDPELLAAIEEAGRGEVVPWTPDMMKRLSEQATENSRRGHQVRDDIKY